MFGHSESHFESFPKKQRKAPRMSPPYAGLNCGEVIWQINPKNITQEIPALEFPL